MPDDIGDALRAMLKFRMRSDAAYRGVAKRVERERRAHDAGLIRKARQAANKARLAPKPIPKPIMPKIAAADIGRVRRDAYGNRSAMDRHGRWWRLERDTKGWHAYGPPSPGDGGKWVPSIHRRGRSEVTAVLKRIGHDLSSYYRFVAND